MVKKPVSKKPHAKPEKHFGGRIVLPPELLPGGAIYESLPNKHEVDRAEKQKEYVASLSDTDRAKYIKASDLARQFQTKYAFKIEGTKYFPFTFNFRSQRWTVTWDREWLDKASKTPKLAETIEHLIESLAQLAPRVKDAKGNNVPLVDTAGNPLLGNDGSPLYKTNFAADKTFERK